MPFPDGMLTRVVSFPTFVDLEGLPVKATLRVFASRPLVWAATGQTVLRDAELVMHETSVQMTLPTTDQAGITDGAGNIVTDWTYTVAYQLGKGGPIPDTVFDLPIEDSSPVIITRDVSGLVSGGVVNVPYPVEGDPGPPGAPGVVQSVVAGTNVSVDNTDPANPVVSATPGGGGGATWGSITGTLSSQTDLQTALNGKQAAGSYAAAVHTHAQADVTNLTTDLAGKAAASHTHNASDINAGTLDVARLPASVINAQMIELKGDLIVGSANDTVGRLALGSNGTVPIADGAEALGIRWGAPTPAAHSHAQSDITNLSTDLAAKAPLASPVFTGNPTAPTPTAGDNDTSIATTAFVQTAKVDATVAEFIRDTIWLALIGGTDITISQSDPSDTITIAYSGHGLYVGINAQTGTSYAPVLSDRGKLVTLSNAGAITVTMPSDATTAFAIGAQIDFSVIGAGMATFVAGASATVNATPSAVTRAQYSTVTAIKRAANTWLLVGDLA